MHEHSCTDHRLRQQLEERDLATSLGTPYLEYRRRVPMLVPRPGFATQRLRAARAT
jgi:hypothetical protein